MSSRQIAEGLKTNPVVIRRLMLQLSDSGLIASQKGRDGGVWLSLDPKNISLDDIYKAINTPDMISDYDRPQTKSCPVSCSMKKIIQKISQHVEADIHKSLSKLKLSDLIQGVDV